jgi:hypothetical protein
LRNIWKDDTSKLDLAHYLVETDPISAAMFAGKALDVRIDRLCKQNKVQKTFRRQRGRLFLNFGQLIKELDRRRAIPRDQIDNMSYWWEIRNDAVHQENQFDSQDDRENYINDVKTMIDGVRKL